MIRFFTFWYPDSLTVVIRLWRNSLMVVEEDLAVGLMLRLLFVPLFHDASYVGRFVSFFFRLSRVILGISAYFLISTLLFLAALVWFLLPILILTSLLTPFLRSTLLIWGVLSVSGIALFIDKLVIDQPHKKLWQIKSSSDLFKASKLKEKDILWNTLLETDEVKSLLTSLEIDAKLLTAQNTPLNKNYLEKTWQLAKATQTPYVTSAYFFVGMLMQIDGIATELLKYNLKLNDFYQALLFLEHKRQKWRRVFLWDDDFSIKHLKGVNRGWMGVPTPNLDLVCEDLTREASRVGFDDFIGRSAVVSQIVTVLSQSQDRNVMLVGPAGSGKSALVKYLAKMIIAGDAPEALATKRFIKLDLPRLLSNTTNEGELASKVQAIFQEVEYAGNIIIFIDEIHSLGTGEAGKNLNLYSLLQPFLESNTFQFITSTEGENYAKVLEKNSSFARIFHKVELPPASVDDSLQILQDRAIDLLRYKKVEVTFKALKEIVVLSHRLIHDLVLPDSAISVLNECLPRAVNGKLDSRIVKDIFETRVKVPIVELDDSKKQQLLNLENLIHQEMIDQEEAVKKVADALRRGATAMKDQSRPIGSFLFVGPTGVGKTELAKTLAKIYFSGGTTSTTGSETTAEENPSDTRPPSREAGDTLRTRDTFVRFDMSEYQTAEAVNRLIGTSDSPGELTEVIRNKPYCLLLLDEFEKADPKILTLFLQVLEDGRLTDASGKTTNFTDTIIIATSNAASLTIAGGLQMHEDPQKLEAQVKEELLTIYKPELINRFDEVVMFKPLSHQDLQKVVLIKLVSLIQKVKSEGYLINFDENVVAELAKRGYDPVLGARPLRRLIQDTIESKLSKMILENKLVKGTLYSIGLDILS